MEHFFETFDPLQAHPSTLAPAPHAFNLVLRRGEGGLPVISLWADPSTLAPSLNAQPFDLVLRRGEGWLPVIPLGTPFDTRPCFKTRPPFNLVLGRGEGGLPVIYGRRLGLLFEVLLRARRPVARPGPHHI